MQKREPWVRHIQGIKECRPENMHEGPFSLFHAQVRCHLHIYGVAFKELHSPLKESHHIKYRRQKECWRSIWGIPYISQERDYGVRNQAS